MKFEGNQINIPIKGIMRAGTDNLCADGAMNEVIGMEYKDGSWLPYKEKERYLRVITGTDTPLILDKVWVHKISDDTQHYVFLSNGNLYYPDNVDNNTIHATLIVGDVKDISFVGNMLNVATEAGVKHYIWSGNYYSEKLYNIPKIEICTGYGFLSNRKKIEGIQHCLISRGGSDESIASNRFHSGAISAIGALSQKGGLFGYSLCCYAFRLKNGDVVQASTPMLVGRPMDINGRYDTGYIEKRSDNFSDEFAQSYNPQTEPQPDPIKLYQQQANGGNCDYYNIFPEYTTPYYVTILNYFAELSEGVTNIIRKDGVCKIGEDSILKIGAAVTANSDGTTYRNVSNPYIPNLVCTGIYRYDSSSFGEGDVTKSWYLTYIAGNGLKYKAEINGNIDKQDIDSVCFYMTQEVYPFEIREYSDTWNDEMYQAGHPGIWKLLNSKSHYFVMRQIRRKNESDIISELKEKKNFYLVEEIKLSNLEADGEWHDMELQGKLGDSLVLQEQLPLSAFNKDDTIAQYLDAYNYRLHLYNYINLLFSGYSLPELYHQGGDGQQPVQYFSHVFNEGENNEYTRTYKWEIKVTLHDNYGDSCVISYDNTESDYLISTLSPLIMYPNENADTITIHVYAYDSRTIPGVSYNRSYEVKFELKHDWLPGFSYYIDPELKPIVPKILEIAPYSGGGESGGESGTEPIGRE